MAKLCVYLCTVDVLTLHGACMNIANSNLLVHTIVLDRLKTAQVEKIETWSKADIACKQELQELILFGFIDQCSK